MEKTNFELFILLYLPTHAYFTAMLGYLCLKERLNWPQNRKNAFLNRLNLFGLRIAQFALIVIFLEEVYINFLKYFFPPSPEQWVDFHYRKEVQVISFAILSLVCFALSNKTKRTNAVWSFIAACFLILPWQISPIFNRLNNWYWKINQKSFFSFWQTNFYPYILSGFIIFGLIVSIFVYFPIRKIE
jgi:hypothetical protein